MNRFSELRLSGLFGVELSGGHASRDFADGEMRTLLEDYLVVMLWDQHEHIR